MQKLRAFGAIVAFAMAAGFAADAARADAPRVVASIKPVHSLVAGVMAGVGEPELLVRGAASPHSYSLKPSDARALESADVVFWIGEGLELFLARPLATLAGEGRAVELADTGGLLLYPPREGGLWNSHDGEHEGEHAEGEAHEEGEAHAEGDEQSHAEDHDHAGFDGHLWLDPRNAKLLVGRIVAELAARDPADAATYRANGAALEARLEALDGELAAQLAPVADAPFIVFHDAYQYFEKRYGLTGVGSVTLSPEQPPGARRLGEIRDRIAAQQARCVFREPNFEPALVDTVIEGTVARTGILDPEGAALSEGPDLYFELMRDLAGSLEACLSASS